MYKLYYQDQFLFQNEDKNEVIKELSRHLNDVLKYKSHYFRFVDIEDNKTMVDYGSHFKFYFILNE